MSVSPDCRDGKHRACVGEAWDPDTDDVGDCPCACHAQAGDAELQAMLAKDGNPELQAMLREAARTGGPP